MTIRSEAVTALVLAAILSVTSHARGDEVDELEAQRERFRSGTEAYRRGAYADAIVAWEEVYRSLGPERGYRMAFNLGRAYDAYQKPARAAESYEHYVEQVEARKSRGEPIEPIVEQQAEQARTRLAALSEEVARLTITSTAMAALVRIDGRPPRQAGFSTYVVPGDHHIIVGDGPNRLEKSLHVEAGDQTRIRHEPPPLVAEPTQPPPKVTATRPPARPRPAAASTPRGHARPFAATWIYVAAGVTAASVVVPVLTYDYALSVKDEYDASSDPAEQDAIAGDYRSAKSRAYATVALPITLGAITAALATTWLVWPQEKQRTTGVILTPVGAVGRF